MGILVATATNRQLKFYRESVWNRTHTATPRIYYENEAGNVAAGGSSTKISGCHEAADTRTRRVMYMFSNDVSSHLQPKELPL